MIQPIESPALLILGESGAGKTHYGAQLLHRLNAHSGSLRMRSAATNLTAFESALQRLGEGRSAGHTATADYMESRWPVVDRRGQDLDLVWPDYGGEQIRQMIERRRISPGWRERLSKGDGWILLVRIQQADLSEDLISRPLATLGKAVGPDHGCRMPDQSRLVELLQLLLYVRRVGTLARVATPALTVLLSCWDELGPSGVDARPGDLLGQRLPLFADFVLSNWQPDHLDILGLSALGKPLSEEEPDEDFVDKGPEGSGYIVRADGSRSPDLTIPVANLFERIG